MNTEYRPFPDERSDEFHAFMRYAFSPEQGPWSPEDRDEDREFLASFRGLFDGDDPVAVCGHHEFTLRIRGDDRPVAGLSAVASPPENRRQGHVKRLLSESLAEYREDGVAYSVLWPFEYAFYAKYGWGTVSRYRLVTTPVDQLSFVDDALADPDWDGDSDADAGSFRRLGEDDFPAVDPVLAAMADRYDFTMARTERWWKHRTLRGWTDDPFAYGWERDGELRAVWTYTFASADAEDNDGDGRQLRVNDVAFADETAWLQFLRFCRNHDSQVESVRVRAPPDTNLMDRVADPRAVDVEVLTGPMFRLVDVVDSLQRLSPPTDTPETTVTLDVSDPLASWNDATFAVSIGREAVTVEQDATSGNGADGSAHADARVGIASLSQLYAGYHSVDEAERTGDLETRDTAVRETLASLFPPRRTFLREGF